MAITQISRIKVRTGNNVDLPVLDSGEFGYSTDTKQLYIGNPGSTLPTQNTEILTANSSIPAPGSTGQLIFNNYGYLGAATTVTWDGAQITLGSNADVVITGGNPGEVLTTDGSGNLSWSTGGIGSSGYSGFQGTSGYSGIAGSAGSAGTSGYSGIAGASGYSGAGGNLFITDDTSTNSNRYPLFTDSTGGTISTSYVASTKLYFNPNTGIVSASNFNSLSDISLKENVETIGGAVDIIDKLRGVGFTWKDSGSKSYGVIAQELEQIIPELVNHTGEQMTVNYSGLIGFLINAVKELNLRLIEVENKCKS